MVMYTRSLALVGTLVCVGCHGNSATGPAPISASGNTYYVASQESGADNERCNGQAPTNQGNGTCPFRDFTATKTLHLLDNAKGVTLFVRQGTYAITQGLDINGAGSSEGDRVTIAAFQGETAVLDGRNSSRELLQVSGQYVTVQGLTLQNSAGYNLEVRGGRQIVIQGNRFLNNGASDSLKGDGGATEVTVRDNEFTQWDSQAIDLTAVTRWTIERNRMHDSRGVDAKAIGIKLGSRDITVVDNEISNTQGISMGGTGNAHPDSFEAYNLSVRNNTFQNVAAFAAEFYSCSNCQFQGNKITAAGAGMRLLSAATEGVSGCPGGCQPNQGVTVSGNQLRNLVGGHGGPPDLFWAIEPSETSGLSSANNVYCEATSGSSRFYIAGVFVRFDEWVRTVPTDASSSVAARTDSRCFW
ncbi:MAG TPA: right-handed parallel beta-helix repeat-containing protein [Vicinamibacterales bacterium]|jgi:hypothetical protein|nr:right-handed parallel beta-helix repeat-containing protein [Vicinamibacterales bacterium]